VIYYNELIVIFMSHTEIPNQEVVQPKETKRMVYADDDTVSIRRLIIMRTPSLVIGLLLGVLLSFVVSRFEEVLAQDIRLAFFIPLIVYMAAAVGAQTQSIYTRDLRTGRASFKKYFWKEGVLGIFFGVLSGLGSFIITVIWFDSLILARTVSFAMFVAVAIAPLVAIFVTELVQLEHKDPAVGAGPIATVIQDTLSVLIFGLVATSIVL